MDYRNIYPGDRVVDPIDGEVREVTEVRPYDGVDACVFFTDGGVMGSNEIKRIYTESEVIE